MGVLVGTQNGGVVIEPSHLKVLNSRILSGMCYSTDYYVLEHLVTYPRAQDIMS